jgi:hypothetical protein
MNDQDLSETNDKNLLYVYDHDLLKTNDQIFSQDLLHRVMKFDQ